MNPAEPNPSSAPEREIAQSKIPRREVVNADWLIKLRWVAVIGQILTILFVHSLLQVDLHLLSLGVIISVTAVSNFFLELWFRRFLKYYSNEMSAGEINLVLGLVMTLDMLSLTALLYTTGGPTNPFTFFFFVNLSLSAFLLTDRWSWGLTILSIVCFLILLFSHVQVSVLNIASFEPIRVSGQITIPQAGTLIAFIACASVIVYFITCLNIEVHDQAEDLRRAEAREAQTDKLQALGTLAAGAAHELSTPLSTISVVINEMEQLVQDNDQPSELDHDVSLIKSEIERCRNILSKMSADAGQPSGESVKEVSVREFAQYVIHEVPVTLKFQLYLDDADANETFVAPLQGLALAIGGIIKNAFDAQHEIGEGEIEFHLQVQKTRRTRDLIWKVQDRGQGMTPDVLRRIKEPFFTTKEPGKGTGLGVFLAHSTIERIGGSLKYESDPGVGTTATITLPMD